MVRFGKWAIYHKDIIEAGWMAKLFVKIVGCSSYTAFNFFNQMKLVLPKLNFERILDAGCGKGDFSFYFAEKYPQSLVDGWDKADDDLHSLGDNINVCNDIREKTGLLNTQFFKKDLLEMDEQEEYDLIFSIHVLEHIPNNQKVIENFYNALRPGGYLHIQVPSNIEHEFYFLNKYTNFAEWEEEEHVGDMYSLAEFSAILREKGFKVTKARTDGNFIAKHLFDITETLRQRKSFVLFAITIVIAKFLNSLFKSLDNGQGNLIILAQKPF